MIARRSRTRRVGAALAAFLLLGALAACGDDDAEPTGTTSAGDGTTTDEGTSPGEAVQLTVGYLPSASLAPPFVAEDLGCYAEENLSVEMTPVSNPADAIALLSEGRMDAYLGSPSAGMFNLVAGGATLRVVAGLGTIDTPEGEDAPSGVFVRSALVESGEVSDVSDLAGRRIGAIGPVGTATSYLLAKALDQGGLTLADVELVTLTLADAVPALENAGVDASFLTAPFTTQAVSQGIAEPIVDAKSVYGDDTTTAVIYGPSLLDDDRPSGAAFLRANACAAERLQGDYRTDDEVVAALAGFLDIPEETISEGALYLFPADLPVNSATLDEMQQVFLDHGDVLTYEEPIPADELTDPELHDEALGDR